MRFDIITIFPKIFDSYLNESILKRAQKNKKIKINVVNLRDFVPLRGISRRETDRRSVDDAPFGGGAGMVFKIEPIALAMDSILKIKNQKSPPKADLSQRLTSLWLARNPLAEKIKIILFSASGKQFNAKMASDFARKYNHIIMIAGHYEGVDERIKSIIKNSGFKFQEMSVGPYVLTGGELPAMIVIDAVSRHIPGVLGKEESLEEKRYGIGIPAYTRPEVIKYKNKKYPVPKVLLSGNHKKIAEWRKKHQK
ncbi:MAG: tRNA (guanosine(37)-N1)-methyltransferase TrmD [Candidatus Azambacteria bacterium]|nr:tRNA (guanosine(37)-N1)-methyltransferase TrmD [Candidatus Azambacteria bacterium]